MKIIVTGATGYIGERLVRRALSLGHEVIAASRRQPDEPVSWIQYDMSSAAEISLPAGIEAVFHLAATTTSSIIDTNMELGAAKRLIKAAGQARARIVYVSSQTAREDAPTAYGRTKWLIEREILAAGGWVIRPGQVYGGPERALFGVLVRAVRNLPILPAFLPAPKVQPVHVDDLIDALLNCLRPNGVPPSVYCVGTIEPVSFTALLQAIARKRVRRYRLSIPIPTLLVRLAGTVLGGRLRSKCGLDRLTSLFELPVMKTERDMLLLGVSLRDLSIGMSPSGNGRRLNLIREGYAFLIYVLKMKPPPSIVRRYVRSIEMLKQGKPLNFPEFMLRFPSTLALLDDSAMQRAPAGAEFAWRLNAAIVLAEASVQGAHRFLAIGKSAGFTHRLVRMAYAVTMDLSWRAMKLIISPMLIPILRNSGLSR